VAAPAGAQNQKALFSLILGIVSIVCCGVVAGIPAVILGQMAKNEIRASGGTQTGEGLAQLGFILGIAGSVLWIIGVILYFLLFAAAAGSTRTYTYY
jgi:hypothetical protein